MRSYVSAAIATLGALGGMVALPGTAAAASNIIFTVVTRLEISRLTGEVEKIDPNAFIVMQSIKDTHGGMVKKRPLK